MQDFLLWTIRLLGLAHLLSSSEVLWNRSMLNPGGLVEWGTLKIKFPPQWHRVLSILLARRVVHSVVWSRAIVSLWLLFCPRSFWALLALALLTALHNLRTHPVMGDSGDDFLQLITISICLQGLPSMSVLGSSDQLKKTALFFILIQAILSYFTAGCFKLKAGWGSGRFLADLAHCQALVLKSHGQFLARHPWLFRVLEVQVMVMQLLSVGVLFMGSWYCVLFVLWSFVFHAIGSLTLGLRSFSFAYLAAYPAFLWWATLAGS